MTTEPGGGLPPLIGVTTSEVRPRERTQPSRYSDPKRKEMTLGLLYARALETAGAAPVVIPPMAEAAMESLLEGLDAICLSGGPDLDPSQYGARPDPELGPTEIDLDRFELALARAADRRGMPLLGICRGAQAMNVARGGTLHQHLPNVPGVTLEHRQSTRLEEVTHTVELERGSRMAGLLGRDHAHVNSFHHQAADRIGEGLLPVAWAPDGVIEGIESTGDAFYVGAQWHVEGLVAQPEHLGLLQAFVDEGRQYAARGRASKP